MYENNLKNKIIKETNRKVLTIQRTRTLNSMLKEGSQNTTFSDKLQRKKDNAKVFK